MKTLIFKGIPINSLLDDELKILQEAGIEVAITNNNGKFGINNKTDLYPTNTNTIIFMWPEYYVEDKEDWIDHINNSGGTVADVIKRMFEFRNDINWLSEWEHLKGQLQHMNYNQTMKYNLVDFSFG